MQLGLVAPVTFTTEPGFEPGSLPVKVQCSSHSSVLAAAKLPNHQPGGTLRHNKKACLVRRNVLRRRRRVLLVTSALQEGVTGAKQQLGRVGARLFQAESPTVHISSPAVGLKSTLSSSWSSERQRCPSNRQVALGSSLASWKQLRASCVPADHPCKPSLCLVQSHAQRLVGVRVGSSGQRCSESVPALPWQINGQTWCWFRAFALLYRTDCTSHHYLYPGSS